MKVIPVNTVIKHYPIGEIHIIKGVTPSGKEVTEFKEVINKEVTTRAFIIKGEGSLLEHLNNGKVTRRFINKKTN